jgi:hypothetical protein
MYYLFELNFKFNNLLHPNHQVKCIFKAIRITFLSLLKVTLIKN